MSANDEVVEILREDKAGQIRRGTPLFVLTSHYYLPSSELRRLKEQSTCLLDLMWICNAKIMANNHPRVVSDKTPHSFPRLDMKHATFTRPIMQMSVQEIVATAEACMFLLDGNVFEDRDRDDAWFEDFEQLLELVRRRAYYLAADTMSPDVHNVEEYANARPLDAGIMVGNYDSDGEGPNVDMSALLVRENKQSTQLNEKFVWDMCSMLTHMDVMLEGYKLIQLSWITIKVGEERANALKSVSDPNLIKSLIIYRRDFECELMCNRADKRIYHRKVPLQPLVTPHTVMGAKNPILIDPKNFPMNMDELTRKNGVTKTQYRLSYDAILCFHAKQSFEEADQYKDSVVNMLILNDWENLPSLELGPRIIRIRVIQKWGCVSLEKVSRGKGSSLSGPGCTTATHSLPRTRSSRRSSSAASARSSSSSKPTTRR
jgi:hypothetical protein